MQTNLADFIKNSPEGQEADAILRSCVHCGFCTATCPTYQLLGDELDGPRGRIYLIKQILEVSATKGDFVVDPFMGSGSTIKVCNEMNLKSLGIELDKEMFNIANNYINGN